MSALLEVLSVSKTYGRTKAADRVSIEVRGGEVHALCGENGAGKSTLIEILAGSITPDEGEILIEGSKVELGSPRASQARGIRVIHQELHLVPELSAVDNIFLGNPVLNRLGLLDRRSMERESQVLLERVGLPKLGLHKRVGALRAGERQLVAIAKALHGHSKLLVMDEPTASLTEKETARLLKLMTQLTAEGMGILLVSHHLSEIFAVSDRVSVIRDGRLLGTHLTHETTPQAIAEQMIGRKLDQGMFDGTHTADLPTVPGADRDQIPTLSVDAISLAGSYSDISFDLRAGECLALVGLVGSGRTEILRAIAGIDRPASGTIRIDGKVVVSRARTRIPTGIVAFVPESRKTEGILPELSVRQNLTISSLQKITRRGLINGRLERRIVDSWVDKLRIKTSSVDSPIKNLSGGNQQKVVLGRWLAADSRVFLLDEPTHGVDIGAKAEIRSLIRDLKEKGASVLLVSSDIDEAMALSERMLFLRGGRIVALSDTANMDRSQVLDRLISAEPDDASDPQPSNQDLHQRQSQPI